MHKSNLKKEDSYSVILSFSIHIRVAVLHYGSPSHRVVEQQLLIPGFLPEVLETSGDQENLRLLEKVATEN